MIASKDRRRSRRAACQFQLLFQVVPVAARGPAAARVEDLSPEGVRFQCRDEVRARSGLLLEMRIPDERPVRFLGRAAWVRALPDDGGFEVGGRFEEQSTWGRKAIERYLQHACGPAAP